MLPYIKNVNFADENAKIMTAMPCEDSWKKGKAGGAHKKEARIYGIYQARLLLDAHARSPQRVVVDIFSQPLQRRSDYYIVAKFLIKSSSFANRETSSKRRPTRSSRGRGRARAFTSASEASVPSICEDLWFATSNL